MNKTYETMVLLDNREVKKGWDVLKSDVGGLFEKHAAKIVSARRWDERRLAYPIKGQQRATYLLIYHEAPTSAIIPINRELMYSEVVLRHMTTAIEEIPADAHEPEAEFDPEAIPTDDDPVESSVATEEEEKADDDKSESDGEKAEGDKAEASAEGDAPAEKAEGDAEDAENTEEKDK